MTIFVTWQLTVTLDKMCNSCDVLLLNIMPDKMLRHPGAFVNFCHFVVGTSGAVAGFREVGKAVVQGFGRGLLRRGCSQPERRLVWGQRRLRGMLEAPADQSPATEEARPEGGA